MKFLRQFSIFGLTLTIILSSCTLQKRVYNKGYHVEWKKNNSTSNKQDVALETHESSEVSKKPEAQNENLEKPGVVIPATDYSKTNEDNSITASTNQESPDFPSNAKGSLLSNLKEKTVNLEKLAEPYTKSIIKVVKKKKSISEDTTAKSQLSFWAVLGFAFGLLGIIFIALAITYLGGGWLFLASVLLAIMSIVCSAIGLGETRDGMKGRGFAITGLVLGITIMSLYILAFLLLIIILLTW